MGTLAQDLRHTLRLLRNSPGFTSIAICALALGIGANTAIFTVVNSVLLKPLPYPDADRIVRLARKYRSGNSPSTSIPKYTRWKQDNQVFEAVAAYDFAGPGVNLAGSDRPEQVKGIHVSAEYFHVFGVVPILGRGFTPQEDRPGGPRVAVISHGLWQRRFGGDAQLVGKVVNLSGDLYTVVGILPSEFVSYPPADVLMPLQADPDTRNFGHYLFTAARLKPGITVETAQANMNVIAEQTRRAFPKWMGREEGIAVIPLQAALTGDVRPALLILLGAVGVVLLIACANVANLLLARAATRQREIAVRAALGAERGRIIRQLLTESTVLAAAGAVLGFLLGVGGVRALLALAPGNVPRTAELEAAFALDPAVLAFTVLVAIATVVVSGLYPALQISKPDLNSALKESSSRSGSSLRQTRARSVLVASETALALLLLVGAVLLIRSFVSLRGVDSGFDGKNVLTMNLSLAGGKYATTVPVENLFRGIVQRVEALPGVSAAAPTIALPLEGGPDLPFIIEGRPLGSGQFHGDSDIRTVGSKYFAVFRIPLRRGRLLEDRDTSHAGPVAVINETMARRFWPKQDPIGARITLGAGLGPEFTEAPRTIVGVVGDVRENGLGREPRPMVYYPLGQATDGLMKLIGAVAPMNFVVRTNGNPFSLSDAIQREILAVDRLPVARVRSMEQVTINSTARQNFNMLLLSVFAAIALLLAAIGIYGLMTYAVQQRTQEIGIRMALGASGAGMVRMVLAQGLKWTAAGVIAGLAAAYGLTRLMETLLFGVKPADPVTFVAVPLVLTVVALVANYIPARRATKVDPLHALRYE